MKNYKITTKLPLDYPVDFFFDYLHTFRVEPKIISHLKLYVNGYPLS